MKFVKSVIKPIQIAILMMTVIIMTIFNYFQNRAIFKKLNLVSSEVNSKLAFAAIGGLIFAISVAIVLVIIAIVFRNKKKVKEIESTNVSEINLERDKKQEVFITKNNKDNNELIENVKNINEYTQEIGVSISELADFTDNQVVCIEQFSAALSEVSFGIQQTSGDAQQAATFVANVQESVGVFVESIKEVASIAAEFSHESENAKMTAKDGEKVIIDAINEMSNVSYRITGLVEHITLLGDSTYEIDKILDVINNIANQTNMLSLNASIEAARAGEYGKGFSVVARSIKELADKSKNATNNISIIIKNIQSSIEEAVNRSKDGLTELEAGMYLVKSTGDSIGKILTVVDKTYNHSITLTESTRVQDETSREILNSINELRSIIQNISSTTMEEAAGIEQVTSGIDMIKESIDELSAANSEITTLTDCVSDMTGKLVKNFEE